MALSSLQKRALKFEDQRVKSAFDLLYDYGSDSDLDEDERSAIVTEFANMAEELDDMIDDGMFTDNNDEDSDEEDEDEDEEDEEDEDSDDEESSGTENSADGDEKDHGDDDTNKNKIWP